ncbi:hypothetical protein J3F83DRAFT_564428 [Trichoderma novae-zelandiae]
MMNYTLTDIATRGAILALKAATDWSSTEISAILGPSVRQINRIYARAVKAGFDPSARPLQIKNAYVADLPKTGRPKKRTEEVSQSITRKVQRDRYGREKSCAAIAGEMRKEGKEGRKEGRKVAITMMKEGRLR